MKQNLEIFWKSTWTAWRSGVLSSILPSYARIASVSFADFLKRCPEAKNTSVEQFFTHRSPLPEEFLVIFVESNSQPIFVLTSQRLWIYEMPAQRLYQFALSDIGDFTSYGRDLSVTLPGTESNKYEFRNLPIMFEESDEKLILLAIEESKKTHGWILLRSLREKETRESNKDLAKTLLTLGGLSLWGYFFYRANCSGSSKDIISTILFFSLSIVSLSLSVIIIHLVERRYNSGIAVARLGCFTHADEPRSGMLPNTTETTLHYLTQHIEFERPLSGTCKVELRCRFCGSVLALKVCSFRWAIRHRLLMTMAFAITSLVWLLTLYFPPDSLVRGYLELLYIIIVLVGALLGIFCLMIIFQTWCGTENGIGAWDEFPDSRNIDESHKLFA